jgi:hypothetical protein
MAKTIIQNEVETQDNKVFTVKKVADTEEDIIIEFENAVSYKVVKLSIADLPPADSKKKNISWINNFGVMDDKGKKYLDQVSYTVFLPPRAHGKFIYQDKNGLKKDKTPKARGSKPERPGWVQVDFNTGDPAIGWT